MMPQLCGLLIGYSDNFRVHAGEIMPVVDLLLPSEDNALDSYTILYLWVRSVDHILMTRTTDPHLVIKIDRRIIC